jgi:hypothetical protein
MSTLTETAEAVDWALGLVKRFLSAVAEGADLTTQLDDLLLEAKNGPGGHCAQSNDETQQLEEGLPSACLLRFGDVVAQLAAYDRFLGEVEFPNLT